MAVKPCGLAPPRKPRAGLIRQCISGRLTGKLIAMAHG